MFSLYQRASLRLYPSSDCSHDGSPEHGYRFANSFQKRVFDLYRTIRDVSFQYVLQGLKTLLGRAGHQLLQHLLLRLRKSRRKHVHPDILLHIQPHHVQIQVR